MKNNLEAFASIELVIFDFDGVFTDNSVFVTENGYETVRCWRSDGLGLSRLKEVGVHTSIISTEKNPVVSTRSKKLGISCKQGVQDKAKAVLETCRELGVSSSKTMFVGNDINDIPALNIVGFPAAVGDAYSEILPHISFLTEKHGGMGAVREICDLIYFAKK